jgi:hypothetical protein
MFFCFVLLSAAKGRRLQISEEYGLKVELSGLLTLFKQLVVVCEVPKAAANARSPFVPAEVKQLLPLDKAATDLVLGTEKGEFLQKVMSQANTSRKGKAVSMLIAHLCWENEAVSQAVVAVVKRTMAESDYLEVRPLFRVLTRLVQLKDSAAAARIPNLMNAVRRFLVVPSRSSVSSLSN